jgi:hypothetical protein
MIRIKSEVHYLTILNRSIVLKDTVDALKKAFLPDRQAAYYLMSAPFEEELQECINSLVSYKLDGPD